MKIIDKFKKIQKKITIFDYILIAFFIFGIIFFAYIFFRKPAFITVTIKVSEDNVIWPKPGSVDWYAKLFYPGMKEKDGLGKIQAEVVDVFSYKTSPNKKVVYLSVRLRTVYTKSVNQNSFKGKAILVGYPIKLQLDNVSVDGLITQTDKIQNKKEVVTLIVKAQTWSESTNFTDTTGIRPYVAESIKIGDTVTDLKGEKLITILNKDIKDGVKLVTTDDGKVIVKNNPLLKDLKLELKVRAFKIDNEYYLFDDIPILIGETIPINLPYISIFPEITKITPIEE